MEHIDYGFNTIESINNIGVLRKAHFTLENQLYYVSLVNVIPAINYNWSKLDLTNVQNTLFSKRQNLHTLHISPKYKLENILLTTNVTIVDGKSFSLIEYLIDWNIGRASGTYSRDFIIYLSSYIFIGHTTRVNLVHCSNRATERAKEYIVARKKWLNKKNNDKNEQEVIGKKVVSSQPTDEVISISGENSSNDEL